MWNSDADVNGWLFVLIVTCIIASSCAIIVVRRDAKERGWGFLTAIRNAAHRMAFAFVLTLVCVGARAMMALPFRVYNAPGVQPGEALYQSWTNSASILISIGYVLALILMTWDYAHTKFGKWVWPLIGIVTAIAYSIGYFGTLALASLLKVLP